MKKHLMLTVCLLVVISIATPALAQTSDDLINEANQEAVFVISGGLANTLAVLGGMLISVIAIYAYALYRSSPKVIQELIVKNGQDTLKAFSDHTKDTTNKIDDKIANVATTIFNAVMAMIDRDTNIIENDETPNTPIQ